MSNDEKDAKKTGDQEGTAPKPDQETLHKTDPQENMKGPLSSLMQNIKDTAEENNVETKEDADIKKDANT